MQRPGSWQSGRSNMSDPSTREDDKFGCIIATKITLAPRSPMSGRRSLNKPDRDFPKRRCQVRPSPRSVDSGGNDPSEATVSLRQRLVAFAETEPDLGPATGGVTVEAAAGHNRDPDLLHQIPRELHVVGTA